MTEDSKDRFASLLRAISLRDIHLVGLISRKTGDPVEGELQIKWSQFLGDGSPERPSAEIAIFRLKYDAEIVQGEMVVYTHSSEFVVTFQINDEATFDQLWSISDVQQAFLNQQIPTTVWPVFRQNILDGMSRLGMKPITLPWLIRQI